MLPVVGITRWGIDAAHSGSTVAVMDSKSYDMKVAETVRSGMRELGLSEVRLAEAAGIPRVTLSRRLSGSTSFSVKELARIASVLGKTPTDLFPDEEESVA